MKTNKATTQSSPSKLITLPTDLQDLSFEYLGDQDLIALAGNPPSKALRKYVIQTLFKRSSKACMNYQTLWLKHHFHNPELLKNYGINPQQLLEKPHTPLARKSLLHGALLCNPDTFDARSLALLSLFATDNMAYEMVLIVFLKVLQRYKLEASPFIDELIKEAADENPVRGIIGLNDDNRPHTISILPTMAALEFAYPTLNDIHTEKAFTVIWDNLFVRGEFGQGANHRSAIIKTAIRLIPSFTPEKRDFMLSIILGKFKDQEDGPYPAINEYILRKLPIISPYLSALQLTLYYNEAKKILLGARSHSRERAYMHTALSALAQRLPEAQQTEALNINAGFTNFIERHISILPNNPDLRERDISLYALSRNMPDLTHEQVNRAVSTMINRWPNPSQSLSIVFSKNQSTYRRLTEINKNQVVQTLIDAASSENFDTKVSACHTIADLSEDIDPTVCEQAFTVVLNVWWDAYRYQGTNNALFLKALSTLFCKMSETATNHALEELQVKIVAGHNEDDTDDSDRDRAAVASLFAISTLCKHVNPKQREDIFNAIVNAFSITSFTVLFRMCEVIAACFKDLSMPQQNIAVELLMSKLATGYQKEAIEALMDIAEHLTTKQCTQAISEIFKKDPSGYTLALTDKMGLAMVNFRSHLNSTSANTIFGGLRALEQKSRPGPDYLTRALAEIGDKVETQDITGLLREQKNTVFLKWSDFIINARLQAQPPATTQRGTPLLHQFTQTLANMPLVEDGGSLFTPPHKWF